MNVTREDVEAGQAVYTPKLLWFYDLIVVYFNMPFVWKCPKGNILNLYNRNISSNHLDVGVGSGYFVDKCRFPSQHPRLGLMDLNPNSLRFTAKRVSHYNPEIYTANILEPIDIDIDKFDSIGFNFVIHCLPGTMDTKLVVFDHMKSMLNTGGVVFGSTILNIEEKQSWLTKKVMRDFNEKKIFSNYEDRLPALRDGLAERFNESEVKMVGSVAIFTARI